jgi:hypothetical protein
MTVQLLLAVLRSGTIMHHVRIGWLNKAAPFKLLLDHLLGQGFDEGTPICCILNEHH